MKRIRLKSTRPGADRCGREQKMVMSYSLDGFNVTPKNAIICPYSRDRRIRAIKNQVFSFRSVYVIRASGNSICLVYFATNSGGHGVPSWYILSIEIY